MTRRVLVRPRAESDITGAAEWYDRQQPRLGDDFVAEVRSAIHRAAAHPRQHQLLRHTPEVRRVMTHRFPYRVFFLVRPDAIVIFRILHHARRDREWTANVPKA